MTMLWAPVLHLYQPPTQFPKVLKKVAEESYVPLFALLERNPKVKMTINISASLSELLHRLGYDDLLQRIRRLAERRQIELTGSAAYHPLLPRLPFSEIARQVKLNEQINRKFFGEVYKPRGFFPPELGYSHEVGDALANLNYEWVLVECCCAPKEPVAYDRVYRLSDQKLLIFFRNKELSLAIAFRTTKTAGEFVSLSQKLLKKNEYLLTAMDGETFGHHWKDGLTLLADLLPNFETVTVSELITIYPKREKTNPMESTWAASHEECKLGEIYPRWDNPGSPLHPKQWELLGLAIGVVKRSGDGKARALLDKAVHSDQFWWASHNPYWHPKMIERGTKLLVQTIAVSSSVKQDDLKRAKKLYKEIVEGGIKLYGKTPII